MHPKDQQEVILLPFLTCGVPFSLRLWEILTTFLEEKTIFWSIDWEICFQFHWILFHYVDKSFYLLTKDAKHLCNIYFWAFDWQINSYML